MSQKSHVIVTIGVWLFVLIASPIIWIVVSPLSGQMMILGAATSLMSLSMLQRSAATSVAKEEGTRYAYVLRQQVLRYGLYIGILVAVYLLNIEPLDYLFLVLGFSSAKFVLILYTLFKGGQL
jgi:hypothetical protein